MKNSFKMKDVVTIALLTALYMVFYMIVMVVITPLGPFGHAISPGLCAVITGSVLIFMSRKVGKMWQFTFMTAILMTLFWIMGGGYIPWVASSMVMAVIADFIASRDGKTVKIWKLAVASGIMHVGQAWGAIIPSWFFLEQYKADWIGRAGMTEESMNAQIQYTQGLMGLLSTVITFVLAFMGVYLGYIILKKHLKEGERN
ncbi:MAG: MptD family putative ECF transporter S component [Catonella sp.]|uniref:MptD family putative ECF transporter S component n=1 Tax=Catonella sp. TaxID=2382125 RepID=UPI003FA0D3CC